MKCLNFDDVVEEINVRCNSYKISGRFSRDMSDFITELMDAIFDMDTIYLKEEKV